LRFERNPLRVDPTFDGDTAPSALGPYRRLLSCLVFIGHLFTCCLVAMSTGELESLVRILGRSSCDNPQLQGIMAPDVQCIPDPEVRLRAILVMEHVGVLFIWYLMRPVPPNAARLQALYKQNRAK
jgi:hypothetical protein